MPAITGYLIPSGYKLCPICAHLHWDEAFKPLYSDDTGDFTCNVCKHLVRSVPVWSDAKFARENPWGLWTIFAVCIITVLAILIYFFTTS